MALVLTAGLTFVLIHEQRAAPAAAPGRMTLRDIFALDWQRHREFIWLVASRFLFLLGTFAVGRFLLYFVADRLGVEVGQAAEATGGLLAGLTLLTAIGAPLGGWAADRYGRKILMIWGALFSAIGVTLLIGAASMLQIFICGGLMAVGSAAFASANWALTADLAPPGEAARFLALANIGTAGASAAAGLFGPLVDWGNMLAPGTGYSILFVLASIACLASIIP